ncbi:hypothetical protein [Methylorubrum thiocyanatum]
MTSSALIARWAGFQPGRYKMQLTAICTKKIKRLEDGNQADS